MMIMISSENYINIGEKDNLNDSGGDFNDENNWDAI